MISSGQISPSKEILFENCLFDLVLSSDGDTVYLQTVDTSFTCPENYKVGDDFDDISEDDLAKMEQMPGWGYYIKLDSGWNIAFHEGYTATETYPESGSKVDWIFRRKD
ncbi:MAG: hypothetical protein ABJG68_06360 [Crocinitomicaceae bacterium]